MNLTQVIKNKAHQLGFSLAGVATPEPLLHAETFEFWLEQGRHGEMSYLASPRSRTCRAHPERILPECKSVLVLGARYPNPNYIHPHPQLGAALQGKVAGYAHGEDYHLFLPARLQRLVQFIESQLGRSIPNRWYTDTGPLLERELAQRAGLGWIGKNTCLINPHGGSYYLLSEILLGIELEPDAPFTSDRCGTCHRCIFACPTGCILPDRTLDARRCISYITIELKAAIPAELRPLMDNWVFGCDICQQVCPWNRFASEQGDPGFNQAISSPGPSLLAEMALTHEEFNHKYRHTPLARAKRRGYLRNVAVALGNSHSAGVEEVLNCALSQDPEHLVRGHAVWALGQINTTSAWLAIQKAAAAEEDPSVLLEIQAILDRG